METAVLIVRLRKCQMEQPRNWFGIQKVLETYRDAAKGDKKMGEVSVREFELSSKALEDHKIETLLMNALNGEPVDTAFAAVTFQRGRAISEASADEILNYGEGSAAKDIDTINAEALRALTMAIQRAADRQWPLSERSVPV